MTDLIERINDTRGQVGGAAADFQANGKQVIRALSTRFDVLRPLGADDRAWYYLARERGCDSTARIKVLAPHIARDSQAIELFHLETFAASKLSHFNIPKTGEPMEINGIHFCAVEQKQDAWTLRELLDRNGWLDIEKAAEIADQIASALDHAHWLGVLHLRLQPENILVEPNGWVTVKDFGVESSTKPEWVYQERSRKLRAPYASPEQTKGAKPDHRSDLYSLGAILYEMLTDRVPYDSDDADSVKQKQSSYPPAPPYLISMDVSESVSNVVMRLLASAPKNRFDSAVDFQSALDEALNRMT